jgi:hypothetical protein
VPPDNDVNRSAIRPLQAARKPRSALREVILDAQGPSQAAQRPSHDLANLDVDADSEADGIRKACETVPQPTRKAMPPSKTGSDKPKQALRRGRPAKSDQSGLEFVEWWKPEWQKWCR